MTTATISNMSIEEKISTMEIIWDDLCQHQNVQSPDLHQDVLQIREKNRLAGQEQPMDWQEAKREIHNKTR
jgi:Putative addiction module component